MTPKKRGGAATGTAPAAGARTPAEVLRDDVENRFARARADGTQSNSQIQGRLSTAPVPRLVITILADTLQSTMAHTTRIPQEVPPQLSAFPVQLELRLDGFTDPRHRAAAALFIHGLGVPYILTLRASREGGKATLTETERQLILTRILRAIEAPAAAGSLLDLEAVSVATDPLGWKGVIETAQNKGLFLMLSTHDLARTPTDPAVLIPSARFLAGTPGGGAALYKSATRTRDWHDELVVLAALAAGNRNARTAAVMGMGRPTSRLLAPFFRAPLVYAAIDAEGAAAPGQIPYADLLATWWRWGVRPQDAGLADTPESPRQSSDDLPPRLVLLGRPAYHSLSPAMHNAAARSLHLRHRYLPLEPPADPRDPITAFATTRAFFARLGIVGGNATSPFKEALAHAADRLEPVAAALGAANTFRIQGDALHATNTDPDGIRQPLKRRGFAIADARCLILGAGGAARAAAYALGDAAELSMTNRGRDRAAQTQRVLETAGIAPKLVPWSERDAAARRADLIVQCTTIRDENPLAASAIRKECTIFELVYDPVETPLLAAARAAGATTLTGLDMLVAQGAAGFTYWTGQDAPVLIMEKAIEEAQRMPLPASVRNPPEEAA